LEFKLLAYEYTDVIYLRWIIQCAGALSGRKHPGHVSKSRPILIRIGVPKKPTASELNLSFQIFSRSSVNFVFVWVSYVRHKVRGCTLSGHSVHSFQWIFNSKRSYNTLNLLLTRRFKSHFHSLDVCPYTKSVTFILVKER
jgi:hypothetical protein